MKKLFLAYNYLIYRLKSTNEHGVHSPFVFDLLNQVIYNKSDYYTYKTIEELREQLLNSDKKVKCIDLGAGSLKNNTGLKSIKQIARHAAKPPKYAQLLFRLVNRFQPSEILELGTSMGISTAYIAAANSKANITTIEGCTEIAETAKQNFKQLELKNIEQITGNFDAVLSDLLSKKEKLDFVFFDGNHRKQPTLSYFEQCLQKANENCIFIFDDIYWSNGMKQAWEEIKKNGRVTVTIDLFYMGIVFFRKEQVKQHFIISY
ncbi:MAG: O-methyltransferase [Bacteroidota bacterium]